MDENRSINHHYAEIAKELIEKESLLSDIRQADVTIIYLSSDKEKKSKGRQVFGECEKINPKYKWAIPCDYTITVYEPNVITFTEAQLRILLFHELLHIKIDLGEDGTEKYGINPHDIEDFREIIDRYGLDWALPEWSMSDGEE